MLVSFRANEWDYTCCCLAGRGVCVLAACIGFCSFIYSLGNQSFKWLQNTGSIWVTDNKSAQGGKKCILFIGSCLNNILEIKFLGEYAKEVLFSVIQGFDNAVVESRICFVVWWRNGSDRNPHNFCPRPTLSTLNTDAQLFESTNPFATMATQNSIVEKTHGSLCWDYDYP